MEMSFSVGSAAIGNGIQQAGNSAESKMERMFDNDTKQGDKLKLAFEAGKLTDLAKKGEQYKDASRLA